MTEKIFNETSSSKPLCGIKYTPKSEEDIEITSRKSSVTFDLPADRKNSSSSVLSNDSESSIVPGTTTTTTTSNRLSKNGRSYSISGFSNNSNNDSNSKRRVSLIPEMNLDSFGKMVYYYR